MYKCRDGWLLSEGTSLPVAVNSMFDRMTDFAHAHLQPVRAKDLEAAIWHHLGQ